MFLSNYQKKKLVAKRHNIMREKLGNGAFRAIQKKFGHDEYCFRGWAAFIRKYPEFEGV